MTIAVLVIAAILVIAALAASCVVIVTTQNRLAAELEAQREERRVLYNRLLSGDPLAVAHLDREMRQPLTNGGRQREDAEGLPIGI